MDQLVDDECKLPPDGRSRFELPGRFAISGHCRGPDAHRVVAVCVAPDGRWTTARLMGPDDVEELCYHMRKADREALRAWLSGRGRRPDHW